MRTLIGKNPLAMMTELVEHNLSLWKSVNEQLQKPYPSSESLANTAQEPANQAAPPPAAKPEKERKNSKKDKSA
jgi:hypothetical protein